MPATVVGTAVIYACMQLTPASDVLNLNHSRGFSQRTTIPKAANPFTFYPLPVVSLIDPLFDQLKAAR